MCKSYDFEVRRLKHGKEFTIAHFRNLVDACNYAEKQNVSSHEPIFVVRVDYECIVVFDSVKFKRNARNK